MLLIVVFVLLAFITIGVLWLTIVPPIQDETLLLVDSTPQPSMTSTDSDGTCFSRYIIETIGPPPADPNYDAPDLYGICGEQTSAASCRSVDVFDADTGRSGSDGRPDCDWKTVPQI